MSALNVLSPRQGDSEIRLSIRSFYSFVASGSRVPRIDHPDSNLTFPSIGSFAYDYVRT